MVIGEVMSRIGAGGWRWRCMMDGDGGDEHMGRFCVGLGMCGWGK